MKTQSGKEKGQVEGCDEGPRLWIDHTPRKLALVMEDKLKVQSSQLEEAPAA